MKTYLREIIIIGISIFLLMGCTISIDDFDDIDFSFDFDVVDDGEIITETQNIHFEELEEFKVDISVTIASLDLIGKGDDLLDANFKYSNESMKPEMKYISKAGKGYLSLKNKKTKNKNTSNNTWDLKFNPNIPVNINIDAGVGEMDLDFSDINLRKAEISLGVGSTEIDLRGNYQNDVEIELNAGVGELTIYLPDNIGVEVNASKGIGDISFQNLEKNGSNYYNSAYNESKTKIFLTVSAGIGSINLIVDKEL